MILSRPHQSRASNYSFSRWSEQGEDRSSFRDFKMTMWWLRNADGVLDIQWHRLGQSDRLTMFLPWLDRAWLEHQVTTRGWNQWNPKSAQVHHFIPLHRLILENIQEFQVQTYLLAPLVILQRLCRMIDSLLPQRLTLFKLPQHNSLVRLIKMGWSIKEKSTGSIRSPCCTPP